MRAERLSILSSVEELQAEVLETTAELKEAPTFGIIKAKLKSRADLLGIFGLQSLATGETKILL